MTKKSPSKRILLTSSFLEYFKVHYLESLEYFMSNYSYQILDGIGVEFHKVSLDDENFIEEIQKEFVKRGYHD